MDWRELAGRPTVRGLRGPQRWDALTGVWSGGVHIGHHEWDESHWDGHLDPRRGWIIGLCWLATFGAECVALPWFLP
jgi:hypothetical protein